MSVFTRMKASTLADRVGELKASVAELNKQLKLAKAEFLSKVGSGVAVEGDLFRVVVTETESRRCDYRAVVAELASRLNLDEQAVADLCEEFSTVTTSDQMKVSALTGKQKKAA